MRVSTHLWLKAQVMSLSPARQVLLQAGLSVECPLMGEVDVYGAVWVTCDLVCLAWPKFFKNEEFKRPWQWRSHLGLAALGPASQLLSFPPVLILTLVL